MRLFAELGVIVSAGLLGACSSHASAGELDFLPAPAEQVGDGGVRVRDESLEFIQLQTVGEQQIAAVVRAPGRVSFREGAVSEVGSPVDGRVIEMHVRVGERVEVGAPLVSIASPSIASVRGELARAQILVRVAEAEVARQREMAESNVGIASERLRAEAALAEARAMLAAIRASSGSIGQGSAASVIVRAPIAGTVLERRASVGAAVDSGGDPLVIIGEPNAIWIVSEVFERELPLVQPGARAQLSIASVPHPVAATVAAISGAVDTITRRAHVYLTLDDENLTGVRAGMYARAVIEASEGGIGIPTSAVLVKEGGRTVVYVAADERTFFPRDVHIGAPSDGRAPVLSGLAPSDRIVIRGALLLDGTADLLR